MTTRTHTVEKIGGTSMSRLKELRDTLFISQDDSRPLYGRIFVVSAFGGITNLLLEHKKTGAPGVYALFADTEDDHGWHAALDKVATAMREVHTEILDDPADRKDADDFVRERIEGARSCLMDLQRLCSYGHFRLNRQLQVIRELLSGLGEAHSGFVATLLLRRADVNARFVDLSGWRDDGEVTLEQRIAAGLDNVDLDTELPIVTGYAQCVEGLMKEFDRGYSEVTFSRIAAQTGAREAIIHKEFHLSSADPRLVGDERVRKVGHTNYDVADQLSNMGMEAIHPKAAKILRQADVPLRVTNAFEPEDSGTLIDETDAPEAAVQIVTGLKAHTLQVFEPDMVGVKGYDATILEALTRHNIWIVSKNSNANTITHYVNAPLKALRRAENDLVEKYPGADVTISGIGIAAVIGRDLSGLKILSRGLEALDAAGIDVLAVSQGTRRVDVQFMVARDALDESIKILHDIAFPAPEEIARKKAA